MFLEDLSFGPDIKLEDRNNRMEDSQVVLIL